VGRGDRHREDSPDVIASAPDFGVDAGGGDGGAFLLTEAAFTTRRRRLPMSASHPAGHAEAYRRTRAVQAVIP
jgi:hypothetical protein